MLHRRTYTPDKHALTFNMTVINGDLQPPRLRIINVFAAPCSTIASSSREGVIQLQIDWKMEAKIEIWNQNGGIINTGGLVGGGGGLLWKRSGDMTSASSPDDSDQWSVGARSTHTQTVTRVQTHKHASTSPAGLPSQAVEDKITLLF